METLFQENHGVRLDLASNKQSVALEVHADHCNRVLGSLLEEYNSSGNPISVNFRDLVSWVTYGERYSHMIHLYPAKLLPHIPALFCGSSLLSAENDKILDPFSGSGTVALEAILAGRRAVCADSNPLARLITKVKTMPLERSRVLAGWKRLRAKINSSGDHSSPRNIVNLDYWYHPHVVNGLSKISHCISEMRSDNLRDFFRVCFSNTVKRVSLADPRLSVPVMLRPDKYPNSSAQYVPTLKLLRKLEKVDPLVEFEKIVLSNIDRVASLNGRVLCGIPQTEIYDDARTLATKEKVIGNHSIQLVVTSPPYAGAQKYIRSSSLSLGWLGLCEENSLRSYEMDNIGREHYSKADYRIRITTGVDKADKLIGKIQKKNSLRAHIVSNYILEMREAFCQIKRVLNPGGYFVLVAAPNEVCGYKFPTHEFLLELALSMGFELRLELVDDIHSRGLMTKRNKSSGLISREWVYLLRVLKD